LRHLRDKKRTIACCSICHSFASPFANKEAPHKGAPDRLISLNLILLDHLFRKEYIYGLNISPFSTSDVTNVSTPIEFLLQVDAVELR
jgi:hypothetical protein